VLPALPSGPLPLWAQSDVSVNGDDIKGVTLRLQPGVTVIGTLVFEGDAPPTQFGRFQPRLAPVQRTTTIEVNGAQNVVAPDRTFKIEGVVPGSYRMSASTPTPFGATTGWLVKSITRNGKDVFDTPFEIRPGEDVSDIVVTFSDKRTELSGALQDATGQPASQYIVQVFPTDRARWEAPSRWIASTRAGVDGSFRFNGLPPGEYYVCALTEQDPQQKIDAAYLEPLVALSFKVTLAEGEKKSQSFKVGG